MKSFAMLVAVSGASVVLGQNTPVINIGPKAKVASIDTATAKFIKLKTCSYKEPIPGYLESFQWDFDPPVWGTGYQKFNQVDLDLMKEMKKQAFPGMSVAIIKNNELIYTRGFGYSDLEKQAPFMPDQATRCGSISKVATGIIIMRLIQSGKLSFDTNVSKFFKDKVGYDIGQDLQGTDKTRFEKTTVRNLLEMANGYNGNFGTTYSWLAETIKEKRPLSKVQILRGMVAVNTNIKEPGTTVQYNNTAFMILDVIAETAAGKSFAELVQQQVTSPALLPKSAILLSPNQFGPKDPARGDEPSYYQFSKPEMERYNGRPGTVTEGYGGLDCASLGGAGCIAFSAEGLAKFVIAVQSSGNSGPNKAVGLGGKPVNLNIAPFLNAKMWEEYQKPPSFLDSKATTFYRAGQMYKTAGGRFLIEHGATLGHATGILKVISDPGKKDDYQIIILLNSQKPAGFNLGSLSAIAYEAARKVPTN